MVMAHRVERCRLAFAAVLQELKTKDRVGSHDLQLGFVQLSRLVEDGARDLRLTDIMDQSCSHHPTLIEAREAEMLGEVRRKAGYQEAVVISGVVRSRDRIKPAAEAARRHGVQNGIKSRFEERHLGREPLVRGTEEGVQDLPCPLRRSLDEPIGDRLLRVYDLE